jgi:hypothetical protein
MANNGSTTPLRIVPHGYGRWEDDDDAIGYAKTSSVRVVGTIQMPEDLQLETSEEKLSSEPAEEPLHAQADTDELRATPEQIPVHPLTEIFPVLEGPEFDALVSDIAKHGQLEPIVLFEDKILDGRNRFRACVAAGVVPRFEPYQGDDPLGLVVSRNVRRRHLDESQRALVAAKLETVNHGGNRKADQDANLHVDRSDAAKMLNVSERSVASAAKVLGEGKAELIRAVEQGKIKVSAAAKATELCAELQYQVAEKALAGDAKAARTIIAQALPVRPRAEPLTLMLRREKRINAELRKALEEANADFIALRDPLPAEVVAKAAELAALAADDDAAKDELAALALRYRWRLRDLVAESCQHSESVHPSPGVTNADESASDEASAA